MTSNADGEWLWLGQRYHSKRIYCSYISEDRKTLMIIPDDRIYPDPLAYTFDVPLFDCPKRDKCDSFKEFGYTKRGCLDCWAFFSECHKFLQGKAQAIDLAEEL
jgi:hypothetical protein